MVLIEIGLTEVNRRNRMGKKNKQREQTRRTLLDRAQARRTKERHQNRKRIAWKNANTNDTPVKRRIQKTGRARICGKARRRIRVA